MTRRVDERVRELCGTADHPLAGPLRRWCQESRPFLAFAETHASKIRKKTRLAAEEGERTDLLAELALAAWLMRDRRFVVGYEPHRASGGRGPDFQVVFKTHTTLNAEMTRLRPTDPAQEGAGPALRLARALCAKVGQFPAGEMGLLVVVVPPAIADAALVPTAVRLLDAATAPVAVAALSADRVRGYQRRRQHLSALLLCTLDAAGELHPAQLWLNPQARCPLHPEVHKRFLRALPP